MSATRVRRTFRASPVRTAAATWAAIVDVIAPDGTPGREQLQRLEGIAASLIAAEAWKKRPVVIAGVGAQLRIYCLHDEDAIVGDDANEDALSWSPTDGEWTIELPCPPEDIEWVQAALSDTDVSVSLVNCTQTQVATMTGASATKAPRIDTEAFLRG